LLRVLESRVSGASDDEPSEGKAKPAAKETNFQTVSARRVNVKLSAGWKEAAMTQDCRRSSEEDIALGAPARIAPQTQASPDPNEAVIAPPAIERALDIYQQLQPRDQSVKVQARKILTQHIYGMIDRGERDEQRLTVGGLVHLKALEREHGIKSAHGAEASSPALPQEGRDRF
jgi:hypothetical protein